MSCLDCKSIFIESVNHILLSCVYYARRDENGIIFHEFCNVFTEKNDNIRHDIGDNDIKFSADLVGKISL